MKRNKSKANTSKKSTSEFESLKKRTLCLNPECDKKIEKEGDAFCPACEPRHAFCSKCDAVTRSSKEESGNGSFLCKSCSDESFICSCGEIESKSVNDLWKKGKCTECLDVDIASRLADDINSDEGRKPVKDSFRIFSKYILLDSSAKRIVDDIFSSLGGWELGTMLKDAGFDIESKEDCRQ